MYADPTLIRSNVVKISLSDPEYSVFVALSNYTGEQKAVLMREMALSQAVEVLRHAKNCQSLEA
jgi:hypothetical protein